MVLVSRQEYLGVLAPKLSECFLFFHGEKRIGRLILLLLLLLFYYYFYIGGGGVCFLSVILQAYMEFDLYIHR